MTLLRGREDWYPQGDTDKKNISTVDIRINGLLIISRLNIFHRVGIFRALDLNILLATSRPVGVANSCQIYSWVYGLTAVPFRGEFLVHIQPSEPGQASPCLAAIRLRQGMPEDGYVGPPWVGGDIGWTVVRREAKLGPARQHYRPAGRPGSSMFSWGHVPGVVRACPLSQLIFLGRNWTWNWE